MGLGEDNLTCFRHNGRVLDPRIQGRHPIGFLETSSGINHESCIRSSNMSRKDEIKSRLDKVVLFQR